MWVCAIYGYEFTHEFLCLGMKFIPRYLSVNDALNQARDLTKYQLTGVVVLDEYQQHDIFCLEAVLSFIEHLDVHISDPITCKVTQQDYFSLFPKVARTSKRNNGGGAVLHQDTFFPSMRPCFIKLAMNRLADEKFCKSTGWDILFFKTTEAFRQRHQFLEVSYFLLFSGLETYVRRTLNQPEFPPNVSSLINKHLRQLKFNIYDYKHDDLKRSADSYVRLRNALFHNSSLQTQRQKNDGTFDNYKLVDYYTSFKILVSLVVIRAVGFDDPDINFDAWITMQS